MNEFTYDAMVIGSGAAGFAAACRLKQSGVPRVAIVTENVRAGVSRNAGSDKQTYYKLGLGGATDSVRDMARDLFACGGVDGDTALAEAACSARCFLYLAELGVPFPHTEYGEYTGYKTDHDPRARASSAGPLTSKFMTEALERQAAASGAIVLDRYYVTEILRDAAGVCGVAAVHAETGAFAAFACRRVILATGGPAGVYEDSVYPPGHTGATSLAIRAGAALQNLTEWQYGLASVAPRWNVSGSYMQALPRFLSVDETGAAHEFLTAYFASPDEALNAVFLKGYQWPFDAKKARTGSSRIDLAVYTERVLRRRRVYLDFTENPFGMQTLDLSRLSEEARAYLINAGVRGGAPAERLRAMNSPALELYRQKGVDLTKARLEIALCAQHCNGGVSVDANWETDIPGLYAVGECAGTHGITRPGGSALNAGQVGALRAAQSIRARLHADATAPNAFARAAAQAEDRYRRFCRDLVGAENNAPALLSQARKAFGDVCAAIRDATAFPAAEATIAARLADFDATVRVDSLARLADAYRLRDALTVQAAMLRACSDFYRTVGGSRGSAVYIENGDPSSFRLAEPDGADQIQQIRFVNGTWETSFRPVRPLPETDLCFETVWKRFRESVGETF